MSALGDLLRSQAPTCISVREASVWRAAAKRADEYEAAVLALSAQGKGPHAAEALRWATKQFAGWTSEDDDISDHLQLLAKEAES